MAHASPRPTPTRGNRPPPTPGAPRAHTGLLAWGGAAHTSLGGPPMTNAAPSQPITLEIEEFSVGHGTGVTFSINDSSSCHSRAADSLAARLQYDELNTPDINPLTPFQFPTTSELDSPTFIDEGLMDAILSASKQEDEETTIATTTPTSGTEITNSAPVTSRTSRSLETVNVSPVNATTMQAPADGISAPSCIVVGGIPHNIILGLPLMAQPSMLNSGMDMMSNVPLRGAVQQTSLAHINAKGASIPFNRLCSITVPHDSDGAVTDQLRIPYDSVNMTNQTNLHFDHQPSVGNAYIGTSGFLGQKYPNLFAGNSDVEGAGTSPYCTGSISSQDEFPHELNSDIHNQCSVADVKPPTTELRAESELLTDLDAIDPNDAFSYTGVDFTTSVDNLAEMNDEEMKDLADFCEKCIDDKTDFWSTPFGNEGNSSDIAVGSTAMGELDHFGLLSSSQEPGQLLASKLRTNKSPDKEQNEIKPSTISEETQELLRSLNAEEPEVSSGIIDGASMNFFPGDADNFDSLSEVQNEAGFHLHSTHRYLNQNLDLNTPAPTPLRRPHTLYPDKKVLDNDKLKEKLERHLLRTQEYSSNTAHPANLGGCRDGAGVGSRANMHQQSQVALPNSFHLEFDAELNVPSTEVPVKSKPGKVIKVEVMKENRSRLHAPQKPLKRLGSEQSPCFSIRTKKFKVASNSGSGKNCNVPVPSPVASSSGVGQKACFSVSTNASQSFRGSETPSSYCPSGKIILGAQGNACNVRLPEASTITPRYLVIRSTNGGMSAKVGSQRSNNSVNLNIGDGVYPSDHSLRFAAPLAMPVRSTVAPQNQVYSASSIPADVLATSKASQSLASVVSAAATCKTSSNGSRLNAEFTVNASSEHNLCVAGPSNYRPAVANIPPAEDEAASCSDDSSDASIERPTKGRRALGSSSVVGFSRLPRSEQLALDAKKYRKNLKANNLASTKSRLKKKNARLALEREFESLSNQKVERERLFYKLKSQYDVMNKMEVARLCCRGNN